MVAGSWEREGVVLLLGRRARFKVHFRFFQVHKSTQYRNMDWMLLQNPTIPYLDILILLVKQ